MPVESCQRNNEAGYKWGESGFCYLPSEEGGEEEARQKAIKQGQAIIVNRQEAERQGQTILTEQGTDDPVNIVPDPAKYIEVLQHPPSKFSYMLPRWFDKVQGILKIVGRWKKTEAESVQKLLFERAKGWTEETVKEWFDDHPEYHYPEQAASGIFFAMTDDQLTNIVSDSFVAESLPIPNFLEAETVNAIAIRGGWGKNRRRGPDGKVYRDYFPDEFLQSSIPLLKGSAVQTVKVKLPGEVKDDEIPDVVKTLVQELQQYGHPPEMVNMILSQGLSGNTMGIFKDAFLGYPGSVVQGETMTETYVMTQIALADNDHAIQARKLFNTAWKHGLQKSLGLSINYKANVLFTEHEGQPACMFLHCTKFVSCEFTINPAAGGLVLGTTQGERIMKTGTQDKVLQTGQTAEEKNIPPTADVKSESQENVEISATQDIPSQKGEKTPKENSQHKEDTSSQKPEPQDEIPVTQEVTSTMIQDMLKQAMPAAIEDAKAKLLQDITQSASQTVSDAFHAENTARQLREHLALMVTQADDVSVHAKDKIRKKVESGEVKDENSVKFLLELAAQQGVTPTFPGMSSGKVQVGAERKDFTKIRSKLMWDIPLTQAEQDMQKTHGISRFLGIQQEYMELTGDRNMNLRYNPEYFAQQVHPEMISHRGFELADGSFSQAVVTTTYADLLTHVLDQALKNHYESQRKEWMKLCFKGEPYFDNRTHDEFLLASFPEIDVVAENGDYTEIEYGHVEKMQSTSEKRGNLFSVTEEALQDDRLGYIKKALMQLAISVNRTMEHKTIKKIIGYGTAFNNVSVGDTIGGTGLYVAATRNNYINGSIEELDKIVELINLMLTQVDYMDDGGNEAPLILYPWLFVGNITKIGIARSRIKAESEPGRDDLFPSTLNMQDIPDSNFIGVHPLFLHGHQDDFLGIIPDPTLFPGIELQYFRGMETPAFQWEGNQQPAYGTLFSSDRLQLRVKFKHRLFYSQPKAFYALFQSA